jgi:uncharacterized membrane protein YdjX (TVP38/TMEM64 family)
MNEQKTQPKKKFTWKRTALGVVFLVLALIIFLQSGIREQVDVGRIRELGNNPYAAILIIIAMAGAWTFALPGSIFFFITPLLYSPLESAVIITLGSAAGTAAGYGAARFVGGPWVEQFRDSRVTRFLSRHSTFGMIFTLRIVPASQHGILNYSAGLLSISFLKFLGGTILAISIKSFLYATAIQQSVNAANIREALNTETVLALMGLALLGVTGHYVQQKKEKRDAEEEPRNDQD